jgi:glycosyltransferase involved in cell wall biosynthesis
MFSIVYIGSETTGTRRVAQIATKLRVPVFYMVENECSFDAIQTPFVIVARTNTYIHVPNLLKLLSAADSSIQVIGSHPNKVENLNVIDFDASYVFRTELVRGFVPSQPFDISLLLYACRNNVSVRIQGGFHKLNFECSYPHVCDYCTKNFRENNTVFTFGNMSERDMERYHTIVEKELQGKNVQVALAFMIKDEERKVQETLNVYANSTYFPEIYILDTGSTDKTLEKVEEWKQAHPSTNVIVYEEPFRDFSYNRNYLLDRIYASSTCEYILSIDCNDELRNQELFIKYLQTFVRYPVFYITQMWKAGASADPITFKTMRLVKNNGAYRWKYRVHEVLVPVNEPPSAFQVSLPEEIVLYQYREEEYEKEKAARFKRDLTFFLEDYAKHPTDTRIVYYTAQTYFFNQDYVNCIDFSKKRIALANPDVKDEETYQSIFRIAKCHILLNHDTQTIKKWLWRSWDYLKDIEPLLYIAQLYEKEGDIATSLYLYLLACDTPIPNVMLPIRKDLYSYERYLKTAEAYYKRKEYTKTYEYYSKILEHEKSSRKDQIERFLSFYYPSYLPSSKPILAIYGGFFYDKFWDGELFYQKKLSLGGSESMVVKLAHALSDTYNVYVFCNTETTKVYKNVTYIPVSKYDEFLNINKVKHLILSRDSSKVHANAEHTHLWLHDLTHANPVLHDSYSSVIVLSKFHKEYYTDILKKLGKMSLIPKIKIIPNIVDGPSSLPKKPTGMRFIYSSCPTRGLERVVNDFATVKREFPDAELYVYSDFDNEYVKSKLNVPSLLELIKTTPGIHNVGRLPEELFLEECKKANVWYYPTEWKETFCITAVQMIANGVLPIYTPVGSLMDVLEGCGIVMNESFDLISALKRKRALLLEKGFEISKKYTTERVKKLWLQLLK